MGDQNTISLLKGINSALQQILENQKRAVSSSNKQNNQGIRTTADLSKGGLSESTVKPASTVDISNAKISPADLNMLSNVPTAIKEIANISSKTIKNFERTMYSLFRVIHNFDSLDKRTQNSLKSIESIAVGLDKLSQAHLLKLGLSLAIVNKTNLGKHLKDFIDGISDAFKDSNLPKSKELDSLTSFITNISPSIKKIAVLAPLMPMFILSSKMMSPGFKALAKSVKTIDGIKNPEATIKILNELNSFVKTSVVLIGGTVALGITIKKVGAKEIFEGLAVTGGILLSLGVLAIAVGKAGSIMGRRSRKALDSISEFTTSVMLVTAGITIMSVVAGAYADKIKDGLPLVGGIFLGVSALAITVGFVGRSLGRAGRRGVRNITQFAFSMILVTGSLLLMSTLVSSSKEAVTNSLIALGGIILAVGGLALIAAGIGLVMKLAKPFTNEILKIAAFGIALTLGTVLLGTLLKDSWPLVAYGIGATSAVIIAYGGAILIPALTLGLVAKAGTPLLKDFVKIAAFSLALTLGTILVGYVVKQDIEGNGFFNSGIFYGTAGVGAIIIAYSLIINGATRIASSFNKTGQAALFDVMKLIGLGLAITAATVFVGKYLIANWDAALAGFVGLTAIITEAVIISRYATASKGRIKQGALDYKNVMLLMGAGVVVLGGIVGIAALIKNISGGDFWKGYAYVGGVFGLLAGVVTGAVVLSKLAKRGQKTIQQGSVALLLSLGVIAASEVVLGGMIALAHHIEGTDPVLFGLTVAGMAGIIIGAGYLARLASRQQNSIVKGAVALLLCEGVIAGSAIVLGAVVTLANYAQSTGWDQITYTLLAMTSIIVLGGLLAAAATATQTFIVPGIPAVFMIEGLMLGSAVALGSVILVANKAKELGDGDILIGWARVGETLIAMTATLGLFAGIAALFTFMLPVVTIGMPAAAATVVFALGASLAVGTVLRLAKKMEEVDHPEDDIKKINPMLWALGDVAGIAILGIPTWALGTVGFAAMLPMLASMTLAGLGLIKVKKSMTNAGIENVEELGEFAKGFTKVFTFENFNLPIGLGETTKLIAKYTLLRPVFNGMRKLTASLSSLVSSIGGMDDDGRIVPILGKDSSGKPIYGKPVDMAKVSRNIVDAIKTFSEILTTDIAKFAFADNTIKGIEALGKILDPVSKFADALSSFEAGGPGKIRAIRFNDKGVMINTPFVDVSAVAGTIASAIETFVDTLFGADTTSSWMTAMTSGYEVIMSKNGKKVLGEKRANAEIAMGVLSMIIDPVSNFVDTLMKFLDGDGENLVVPEYDKDGNIKSTRKVNVGNIAKIIAGAVSTFANTLFGPETAKGWIDIITSGAQYVSTKKETTYQESPVQKAMGSLGTLLEPVVSFANMLAMFGEAGESGKLIVYDKDGKSHTVDVVNAASSIASAVTNFITELSSSLNNKEQLDFLTNNTETISALFKSFGDNVSSITNIDDKDLDKKLKGVASIFDFIMEKANIKLDTDSLVNNLNKLNSPLTTFINSFIQISTNDLGKNIDTFSTSLKGFSSSIDGIKKVVGESNASSINDFIKNLFGKTAFTNEDFEGLDVLNNKFKDYDEILKAISSMKISDSMFDPLNTSITNLIEFGTSLSSYSGTVNDIDFSSISKFIENYKSIINEAKLVAESSSPKAFSNAINVSQFLINLLDNFAEAGKIINNNLIHIVSFNAQKNTIMSLFELLSSNKVNSIDTKSLNKISSQILPIFKRFAEAAEAINTSSVNALDVNSKNIINFVNDISGIFNSTNFNTDKKGIDSFVNSFRKLIKSLTSTSSDNIKTSANNVTEIKNAFVEFNDVIDYLTTSDLSAATSADTFQKAIDSLFTNISSFADKKNVGKLNTVQKSITATTKSLVSLDNTFLKKNKDRLDQLKKLNESLQELTKNFSDSKEGLTTLTSLVNALNISDKDKVESILNSIGSARNGGKPSRGQTPSQSGNGEGGVYVQGISAQEVQAAVENAINKIFDGAYLRFPSLTITTNKNSTEVAGEMRLDVNGAEEDVYKYSSN